jgi:short-subunit dehydrogenase
MPQSKKDDMQQINMDNRNKYVLITGATSGIGHELTKLFARDGYNLILVARNIELLQEMTSELKERFTIEVTPLAKDLFMPHAAEEIHEEVKQMGITVDILVNDAGQGQWGPFVETPLERELDIIQLNIVALVSLTKLFLRDMVLRNDGKILQVASEAGTAPMPLLSVYAATKAFVLSFTAALADELKDTDITITALLPGATDTDFFHKAQQEDSIVYQEKELLSPEDVAKDGYEALMKGESKIISGAKTKMHVWMSDIMGAKLAAKYMHKLDEISDREGKDIAHPPSQRERRAIGKSEGDYGPGDQGVNPRKRKMEEQPAQNKGRSGEDGSSNRDPNT